MHPQIRHLYHISQKKSRVIIGLMSGTSMDGLDIALCSVSGTGIDTQLDLLEFETAGFTSDFKEKIRKVFARDTIDFPYLAALNSYIANQHGELVNVFLKKHRLSGESVDIIASHGQTVMHTPGYLLDPKKKINATLQLGDGDHIAMHTGIITISDFRQKHIAAGGEGAPLAVYGDFLLNRTKDQHTILLNIGGIANFTFIPQSQSFSEVFVTDTGPGNTLMDTWVRTHFNLAYDEDARIASKGKLLDKLLLHLKSHPFFEKSFPKSTGPEVFNLSFIRSCLSKLNESALAHEDILYTLNQFTADTIAEAIIQTTNVTSAVVFMSGGGVHNPLLCSMLADALPGWYMGTTDEAGIPSDAKEAILFAVLANETIAGNPDIFTDNTNIPAVSMGKISFPV